MKMTVRAIALMKETASTSETLVNFYQTTHHNNPEDRHLHTRRRENLKSHKFFCHFIFEICIVHRCCSGENILKTWALNFLQRWKYRLWYFDYDAVWSCRWLPASQINVSPTSSLHPEDGSDTFLRNVITTNKTTLCHNPKDYSRH
jgi:hypothetical protein